MSLLTPLVKKEIRLLLPEFATGLALALASCLLAEFAAATDLRGVGLTLLLACGAFMALTMTLNSFGVEVGAGTFANLLAQPVARARMWQVKIRVLVLALLVLGGLWWAGFYLAVGSERNATETRVIWDMLVVPGLLLLVVFSGGLWTVLWLRQVTAAFWLTLLVPGGIMVLVHTLTSGRSEATAETALAVALGIYGFAGYRLARWQFLHAQDVVWTGGAVRLPEFRWLAGRLARAEIARPGRSLAALWWKELRLQQPLFIMAAGLALLHLAVLATRHWGRYPKNSITDFVVESFWHLWLVMPLLAGATAMAEERNMGTLDGQLCLPIRWRTQFRIKFAAVALVAILLGTVMPWLLEGNRILRGYSGASWIHEMASVGTADDYGAAGSWSAGRVLLLGIKLKAVCGSPLGLAAVCVVVTALAFYTSTLCRHTLQALTTAVAALMVITALSVVLWNESIYGFAIGSMVLWRGDLVFLIGTPVMFAVLAALAQGNSQRVRVTAALWGRNLLTLGLALTLVIVVTSVLYQRVWELVSPMEPRHGRARWTIANPPRLQISRAGQGDSLQVLLPDGRVWVKRVVLYTPDPFGLFVEAAAFRRGAWLAGTDWACVWDNG